MALHHKLKIKLKGTKIKILRLQKCCLSLFVSLLVVMFKRSPIYSGVGGQNIFPEINWINLDVKETLKHFFEMNSLILK